jgi:hypothetical protein
VFTGTHSQSGSMDQLPFCPLPFAHSA